MLVSYLPYIVHLLFSHLFWFKFIWHATACKNHLIQITYVIYISADDLHYTNVLSETTYLFYVLLTLLIKKQKSLTEYCFKHTDSPFGLLIVRPPTKSCLESKHQSHYWLKAKGFKWLLFLYTSRLFWLLWDGWRPLLQVSLHTCGFWRFHYILSFWRYFICKIRKGVRKVPSHSFGMRLDFSSTR